MNKRDLIIGALVLIVGALGYQLYHERKQTKLPSQAAFQLQTAMRQLWADHAIWTRDYITAALAAAPNVPEVTKRLLQNQQDIGQALVPYYGKTAGDKVALLLKDHILIAADVVAAAKANDNAKLKSANERWPANAQDIAQFLSGANPNWPKAMLEEMLYKHLELTTNEATTRLKQQWQRDIQNFDLIFSQLMAMADDLSLGIIKQFPAKF